MYFKKKSGTIIEKFKFIKIFLILIIILISFFIGAYSHKTHFFYTFLKPLIFQNLFFLKKTFQGKLHNVDKIYLDIDFKTLQKLNDRKKIFVKNQSIDEDLNDWLNISINHNNKNYRSKIRYKGRMVDTHLNPTMRNENVSYKIKINKNEDGNILGMREFNLMDLRRRGYLLEWYAREFLKSEGLIHLDYKFVNLYINGKNHGIYAMDELISEATLTRNKRRDSVSVRIDNNFINAKTDLSITNPDGYAAYNDNFVIGEIDALNETFVNKKKKITNTNVFNQNYPISISKEIIIVPDSERLKNFKIASGLLDNFRKGLLKTEEVFDIDQLAKGFAASDILDGWHGVNWTNMSFYFNPITLKLEPIFQDWYNEGSISTGSEQVKREIRYMDIYNYGFFYRNIFSSERFLNRYIYFLEQYSSENYLLNFNSKIKEEFNNNLKSIYKSSSYYDFPFDLFERKINNVKSFLYHYDPIYFALGSFRSNDFNQENFNAIKIGNKHILPIIISKIKFEDLNGKYSEKKINIYLEPRKLKKFVEYKFDEAPVKIESISIDNQNFQKLKSVILEYHIDGSVKVFEKKFTNFIENSLNENIDFDNFFISEKIKSNLNTNEFLDEIGNQLIIKKGRWILNDDLTIPENKRLVISSGTELILTNNAKIISKSPIFAKGSVDEKIFIKSYSKTNLNLENESLYNKLFQNSDNNIQGQCIIIMNSEDISIFEHVVFDGLRNCATDLYKSEGSLNVYKSKIQMRHILFKNNKFGDDAINLISSEFDLKDITLENIFSDGIDLDFSNGKIENFKCINCANDGIDISNSLLYLTNFFGSKIEDKALSIGEMSSFTGNKIYIENSNIGLAVKDGSSAIVDNVNIVMTKFPIVTYIKKKEFGSAKIELSNLDLKDNLNDIIIEEGSNFKIDNNSVNIIIQKGLYKRLYVNAEY